MKINENHLIWDIAPLMLKTRNNITVARISIIDMTLVAKILLHTICPIRKGCKNMTWLSIQRYFSQFSSCYLSYQSQLPYSPSSAFFYSSSPQIFFYFSWSSSSNLYIRLSFVYLALVQSQTFSGQSSYCQSFQVLNFGFFIFLTDLNTAMPNIPTKTSMNIIYNPRETPKNYRLSYVVAGRSAIRCIPLFVVLNKSIRLIFELSIMELYFNLKIKAVFKHK